MHIIVMRVYSMQGGNTLTQAFCEFTRLMFTQ